MHQILELNSLRRISFIFSSSRLLWKPPLRFRGQRRHFFIFFSIFNGDVLYDLFKWQTSPFSLFLSWGISHWVLMSDYFSHSALDKWLRQAVKNRSKPLGWRKGGGGGGRSREAVKSFPSAARQASENATHYSCATANQSFQSD